MSEFIHLLPPTKNGYGWFVPADHETFMFLSIGGEVLEDLVSEPFHEFYFASELIAHKAVSDYYTKHHNVNPYSDDFLQLMLIDLQDDQGGSRVLEL